MTDVTGRPYPALLKDLVLTPAAVAVLRLNTELYPGSANTYDTLGEVLVKGGDKKQGLEMYRKVLEVLPKDANADPGLKETLRKNAVTNITTLSRP